MTQRRFALYFAAEDGSALAEFGWWWLGRRPHTTAPQPLPDVGLDPALQADLVADARRYGFHATLKPPFRLAEGTSGDALRDAVAAFAQQRRPFVEPPLALADLHGFLAFRPQAPSPAIQALADDGVRAFDRFRAPPTDAERQRRLGTPLTDRQRENVDAWGYPYVFADFRLHLTLTRRLRDAERAEVRAVLDRLSAPVLREPVAFRSVCLFEQADADTPFVLAQRFPFGG